MAKPWAKYEIDYISHQKFLALTANAHSLWWEAKNYCDKFHTDGLFPKEALRTFRFYSHKSVELLTRSCGPKPGKDEPFAPLWEVLDVGGVAYYRMHDYLIHNDCRDEVLERLQDADDRAELRRLKDRKRKQEERSNRKREIDVLKSSTGCHADNPRTISDRPQQTEAAVETELVAPAPIKRERTPTSRSGRVIFDGQKLVVFEWMLDNCLKTLGNLVEQFDIHEWFFQLDAEALAANLVVPKRDGGAWLESRLIAEVQRRGLPLQIASAEPQAPTNKRIDAILRGGQKALERMTLR